MSHDNDKIKNSKRRYKEEVAIKKQVKIAKQHGYTSDDKPIKEPHRYAKHRAMNCGNTSCFLCGNPRKIYKSRTIQEKRFFQSDYDE